VLLPVRGFDARMSERRFIVAAPQYVVATIGADLLAAIQRQAPQVSLIFRDLQRPESILALRSGEVDAAVGRLETSLPGLTFTPLYSDRYCVAARRGHPLIKGRIDLELYCNAGSIFAAGPPDGPGSPGLPDNSSVVTRAVVAQWVTALTLVAQSDCIATCPRRLAERYRRGLGLQVLEPPPMVSKVAGPFQIGVCTLPPQSDPGVDWLLETMRRALTSGAARSGR
jgi:DNA-binding transcriptional LysR family regulator